MTKQDALSRAQLLLLARGQYQQAVLGALEVREIQQKYEALWAIVDSGQAPSSQRWKDLVSRYPGVLREAEMCGVGTIEARRNAALSLSTKAHSPREVLFASPLYPPIIYWHDAHAFLRDVGVWRSEAAHRGECLEAFWHWTQSQSVSPRSAFWPTRHDLLTPNQKKRPDQHTAYAWLAQLAGLETSALMEILVDRLGAKGGGL